MYFSKIVVDRFGKQLYILAINRRGNENNNVQNVWQRNENLNNCAKFKTVISECMGNFHNLYRRVIDEMVVFLIFQRYIIDGMTAGAVKG